MKRKAFTLIELLVVIAIIAILAAILFPVFATAREKARQTSCASNEKQLGLAILQYVEDYDEVFPCGVSDFNSSGGPWMGGGWGGQVYAYVKSTGAYMCPDDTATPKTGSNGVTGYPVSYAFNFNLAVNASASQIGVKLSELNSPTQTVGLCEVFGLIAPITDPQEKNGPNEWPGLAATVYSVSPATMGQWVVNAANAVFMDQSAGISLPALATGPIGANPLYQSGVYAEGLAAGRHTQGSNFLLTDGHVKWLRPTHISIGLSAATSTASELAPGGSDTTGYAAGTGNSTYTATFSTI